MVDNDEYKEDQNCCIINSLLQRSFESCSDGDKLMEIIKQGRPKPVMSLSTKIKTCVRHFNLNYFESIPWLTGCYDRNKLFCWPCLLFSMEKNVWNSSGFSDLNNLSKAQKRHETSLNHLKAMVSFKTFGCIRIDSHLNEEQELMISQHNDEVSKNRQILERLIMVTCHLGIHELAFQGHDECDSSSNRGNYVDTVYLLSQYDELLSTHLSSASVFSDLSNQIQNDLINSVGNVLLSHIKEEIANTSFVAISLDETTDCSNLAQLSIVLRYYANDNIQERFVEFSDISQDRTSLALSNYIFDFTEKYNFKTKLIAQTYDGAAVMSGHLSDQQARVKQECPEAIFIHCCAHRIDLVLSQALEKAQIKEAKIFFKTIRGLASFFSKSTKLDEEVKKRFPTVSGTAWAYNGRIVRTLFEYREDLIRMFESILTNPDDWDSETYNASRGYLTYINDFDCCFLLIMFSDIFALTDELDNILQTKTNDIKYCLRKIDEFKITLNTKGNHFDTYWTKVNDLKEYIPSRKRLRIDNVSDQKKSYNKLFFEILDILIIQVSDRFQDLTKILFLELIHPEKSDIYSKHFPENSFQNLVNNYGQFFDVTRLRNELIGIYNFDDLKNKDVGELLNFINSTDLKSAFPQVVLLCELILTIPATSVSVERSFSALNRIKSFSRNACRQTRSSKLALISIEKILLNNLISKNKTAFINNVVEDFVQQTGRIELIYK